MRSHIASLQRQVDSLFANLNSLQQHHNVSDPDYEALCSTSDSQAIPTGREPPSLPPPHRQRKSFPCFHGPTSSAYGFDVAISTLQTMGITQESTIEESAVPGDRTAPASPLDTVPPHPSKDPLWSMSREEGIRLCRIYEEEIGIMYPLFDIEAIIQHVNMLWTFLEAALRSGFGHIPGADAIDDDDTNLVKMILAAALILEGNGQSDLGQRIFESLKPAVTAKFWGPTDTKGLSLICVAVGILVWSLVDQGIHTLRLTSVQAMYYFNRGDEGQAWRLIGVAARSCIEMGLHRRESLLKSFSNEAEYLSAAKLFWVVYALDRRWSFGMGMPFALQDADIDSSLPVPVSSRA